MADSKTETGLRSRLFYLELAFAVASKSRASAIIRIGFFTLWAVDISICHLQVSHSLHTGSPRLPVYLVLQALTSYLDDVAGIHREPLPHVFTLTCLQAVVFCYVCHKITPIWAFPSRVPCPVRTFLTRSRNSAARQIVPPFIPQKY